MPNATPRFCPRCRAAHIGRCPQTQQDRKAADARRGSYRERGYTTSWDKFRALVLKAEPFCRHCQNRGRLTPAKLVDHIVPLIAGGELLDGDNCQPLCTACHAIKTREDYRKYSAAYGTR